jgi:tRNA pseudouridine55 synthase
MFGVLNINKPAGLTSRDVVNRVQGLVRPHKAGHAGPLDPLATGVLLVCVGQATRLVEFAQRLRKHYRGTFLLGRRSDTEDADSAVEVLENPPEPTRRQLEAAAARFVGNLQQRPSRQSAIKVAGRRAYELARAGADFEQAPRAIVIHGISIVRYQYPELVLDVQCGAGTYIRALGRDLAEALGTGAVMTALERTRVGSFHVAQGVGPAELRADGCAAHLQAPSCLVDALPRLTVNGDDLRELQHGRAIEMRDRQIENPSPTPEPAQGEIAAFDAEQNLVAILRQRQPGLLYPVRNFTQPEPAD